MPSCESESDGPAAETRRRLQFEPLLGGSALIDATKPIKEPQPPRAAATAVQPAAARVGTAAVQGTDKPQRRFNDPTALGAAAKRVANALQRCRDYRSRHATCRPAGGAAPCASYGCVCSCHRQIYWSLGGNEPSKRHAIITS